MDAAESDSPAARRAALRMHQTWTRTGPASWTSASGMLHTCARDAAGRPCPFAVPFADQDVLTCAISGVEYRGPEARSKRGRLAGAD